MARRSTHASRAWLILIKQAQKRQTLTYGILHDKMGSGAPLPWYLGPILEYILRYCKVKELPRLDLIVVSKSTGKPGTWSGKGEPDLSREYEAVFDYDWDSIVPPSAEELETVFAAYKPD